MNDQWLNDLHRKMEDHEEDIPDGLWDDIKDELFSEQNKSGISAGLTPEANEEEIHTIISGRSILYRICGMAAAIAMLFFTGRLLLDINAEKNNLQITKRSENENSTKNRDPKTVESVNPSNKDVPETANTRIGEKYSNAGNVFPEKIDIAKMVENVFGKELIENKRTELKENTDPGPVTKEVPPVYGTVPPINESPLKIENKAANESLNTTGDKISGKYTSNGSPKSSSRKSKQWMLSLLTGNVSSDAAEQRFPGYASMNGSPLAFSDFWSASTEGDPLTEVLLANQSKEVEARIRHKIPVTFGLSMYYNLGKKWGIGTGVNYTKLMSDLHSGSNSNYIKGEQAIHYIGIPVQVNYNVIQKGRFTGYVTGGVLAEKAVAGKLTTKYIVNDVVQETMEEKINVKPVQLSVNSAVGLQVKIIDKIGIYAEPGIGYHFKNESELNTIYKEKPLNFNMKFGIRVLLD